MSIYNPQNLYQATGGSSSTAPLTILYEYRDPTTTDIAYPVLQMWYNSLTHTNFQLNSFTSAGGITTANWIPLFGIPLPVTVPNGGTGDISFTPFAPITGGTTSTGPLQSADTGFGNVGYVLTSTGSGSLPTWQLNSPGSGIVTIDGDSGSVTGTTISLIAGQSTQNSGSSVSFDGVSPVMTFNVTDANSNTIIGNSSGNATLSGSNNTVLGAKALSAITSGSDNLSLGVLSGSAYTSTESSNILIGNVGTLGESNKIHIGTAGSGAGQQNSFDIIGKFGLDIPTKSATIAAQTLSLIDSTPSGLLQLVVQNLDTTSPTSAVRLLLKTEPGAGDPYIYFDVNGSAPQSWEMGDDATDGSFNLNVNPNGAVNNLSGSTTFKMSTAGVPQFPLAGTPTNGYVLTSDASGNGTWKVAPASAQNWTAITASQTLLANASYMCISPGGALSLALPATSPRGSRIEIILDGATSFTVTQAAGQQIQLGSHQTTAGVGGSITTTSQGDSLVLICTIANLRWVALSAIGNPTIV